jgi:hypothetical protein
MFTPCSLSYPPTPFLSPYPSLLSLRSVSPLSLPPHPPPTPPLLFLRFFTHHVTQVIFHIANLYDMMANYRSATKWFSILNTRVPTDPGILSRLGAIFNKEDDENQAFHYHQEAYNCYPVNLDVTSWLGVWYVNRNVWMEPLGFRLRMYSYAYVYFIRFTIRFTIRVYAHPCRDMLE